MRTLFTWVWVERVVMGALLAVAAIVFTVQQEWTILTWVLIAASWFVNCQMAKSTAAAWRELYLNEYARRRLL